MRALIHRTTSIWRKEEGFSFLLALLAFLLALLAFLATLLAFLAFLEPWGRLLDVVAQLLLQLHEVRPAGAQHLAHLGRVEDREQQVLDRQVLVACLTGLMESIVETVFELVG